MSSSHPFLTDRLAESAHYALMRRLLPAIRHDLAGSLQPISMMAVMLERRAKSASPDLIQLANNSQTLQSLSREAAAILLNLTSWLAPKDNNLVAVGPAVLESLSLMDTELSFRGFSVANQTIGLDMQLPRGMLRSVFTASLIALTDGCDEPASVLVTAGSKGDENYLQIVLQTKERDEADREDDGDPAVHRKLQLPIYRCLGWDDVLALASAEGVRLSQSGNAVCLGYPVPPH